MLNLNNRSKQAFRTLLALLFFISGITFQSFATEDIKEKAAKEYRALGYAEQKKGNLSEALSYYTKAVSLGLGQESAVLMNDMGVLYEDIGHYGKAEDSYLRSIQADENYLPPYGNLAYLYQRLGRIKESEKYFRIRFELGDPRDPWTQKAKSELIEINPRYHEWAVQLEADSFNKQLEAKARKEFYESVRKGQEHYQRGNELFDEQDYDEALKEYEQALRLSPENPHIVEARKEALLAIAKQNIKEQSEEAIKRLDVGDTLSAQHEIQKMLTTIPKEPILISPQYAR